MNTQKFDWTDARIATLKELHKQGLSASQIADRLGGVSRNAIIGKVHRLHIGPLKGGKTATVREVIPARKAPMAHKGKPSFTIEMVTTAMQAWDKGMPAEEIGVMIGKTGKQVLSYASEHRAQFPSRKIGRQPKAAPMVRRAEPEFIAPQFLVAPEGYDAERMEHAKPLHELEAKECHWPLNNGSPFLFCAAEKHQLSPYCRHHFLRSLPKARAA